MKDTFENKNMSFLHEEAEKVRDWPEGMQGLFDKGLVSVWYDEKDNPHFSLTRLGRSVCNEIDPGFN